MHNQRHVVRESALRLLITCPARALNNACSKIIFTYLDLKNSSESSYENDIISFLTGRKGPGASLSSSLFCLLFFFFFVKYTGAEQFDAVMKKASDIALLYGQLYPVERDAKINHMTLMYMCGYNLTQARFELSRKFFISFSTCKFTRSFGSSFSGSRST